MRPSVLLHVLDQVAQREARVSRVPRLSRPCQNKNAPQGVPLITRYDRLCRYLAQFHSLPHLLAVKEAVGWFIQF